MKTVEPGETLETASPPSEAISRQEVELLPGEVAGEKVKQKFLPIILFELVRFQD